MALVYAQTKPPDTYLCSRVIFPTGPFPLSMLQAGDNAAGALSAYHTARCHLQTPAVVSASQMLLSSCSKVRQPHAAFKTKQGCRYW